MIDAHLIQIAREYIASIEHDVTPLVYYGRHCVTSAQVAEGMDITVSRENIRIISAAMRRSGWTHRQMRVDGYPTWVWVASVVVAEEGAA